MENRSIIEIKGLHVFANHGVLEEEKKNGQEFIVDAKLYSNLCKPAFNDSIYSSTNYASVCQTINDYMKAHTFDLIEKVAYELTKEILVKYEFVDEVNITLHKPNAPIDLEFDDVSVNINNKWNRVYLSIGSNMGDKKQYINEALCKLGESGYIKSVVPSSLIETEPYGYVNQDKFINGAISLLTVYNPYELLEFLHSIENACDRVREIRWGPRTLDLDIVFYEKIVLDDPDLLIPHIDMANREFVLKPLMELCPDYVNQRTGLSVRQMYDRLEK